MDFVWIDVKNNGGGRKVRLFGRAYINVLILGNVALCLRNNTVSSLS